MSEERFAARAPATLDSVAAAAGVSKSTVSRVINGSSQVSPAVLAAVTAAIAELDYTPNRAARSLVNRQTMAIALVVPEESSRFFGDPYFSAIMDGISEGLEDSEYVLTLQLAKPQGPSEKTRRYLLGGNVDGALVVSHHANDEFLSRLDESLPVVFGGRPLRPEEQRSFFVDIDNAAAAQKGTEYLVGLGRTRIATITGPADMPAGLDRLTGWTRALETAGLEAHRIAHGDFTGASGARAMRALLDTWPDLDAVFVASDLMANGAVAVLQHERGLSIPRDVAIMGFDDSPAAVSGELLLTTVRQPSREMGAAMAHTLLALLRGEQPQRVNIMDTRIIVRASA